LNIADTQIDSEGMLLIARAVATTKISTLKLGLNQIGSYDKGIEALKILLKSTELKTLEINSIGLEDNGLATILNELKNSEIKKIVLSSNNLTDRSGKELVKINNKTIVAVDNNFKDPEIINKLKVR